MIATIWLLAGVALIVGLILADVRVKDINNPLVRRATLAAVVVVCYPAMSCLTAIDHFMKWATDGVEPKKAFQNFLKEIGPDFFSDMKETW